MKKNSLLFLLFVSLCNIAAAQTVTASGSVKDVNGNFLHFAFIQDKQSKNGTYTDSLGNFSLQTSLNASLAINCTGYKDTLVSINGKDAILIVLHPAAVKSDGGNAAAGDNDNKTLLRTTLRDEINLNPSSTLMAGGSILPAIHTKDATQGSKTLFKDWVHGYVINSGDSLVQNPGFLLNYDKMAGTLLLTEDKASMIALYKDKVKSFTLFDMLNQPYTFTIVPAIDKSHYVQVISSGNNYSIYKLTKTKFIASNYSSDGIASVGNNYDEYEDEFTYYVLGKSGVPQKISLKKKSLKEAFNESPDKLNQYFKTNDGDIDDGYLHDLGDYMNK